MIQPQILMLATDQQNYAFDLTETFRIAIGRHAANDIQLNSRIVSNYHAEILNDGESVVLHDLRSANGTMLNEERVSQRRIKNGDRIQIGGHVLTVKLKDKKGGWLGRKDGKRSPGVPIRGKLVEVRVGGAKRSPDSDPGGEVEFACADLLMKLADAEVDVMVELQTPKEKGAVYLEKGQIFHAQSGKAKSEKALYRILQWSEGTYLLKALPRSPVVPRTISLPAEALIIEGMQQSEEVEKIAGLLPAPHAALKLNEESELPLNSLSPAEIEIFQEIIRHETIDRVLEASPLTDFRALHLIHSLLQKKVFRGPEAESSLLEQTTVYRPGQPPSGAPH